LIGDQADWSLIGGGKTGPKNTLVAHDIQIP